MRARAKVSYIHAQAQSVTLKVNSIDVYLLKFKLKIFDIATSVLNHSTIEFRYMSKSASCSCCCTRLTCF